MNDPGIATTAEERRQLFAATVSAGQFFRGELLRDPGGWPVEYLKESHVESVLSEDSAWRVGYAPDARTGLVDHLAAENFSYSTMERAGLVIRNGEADVVDRFRDQIVLLSRDSQLRPAGFVQIDPEEPARAVSPVTAIHQPSNVLVGVEEQIDLLRGGAIPVIVEEPVDAIAVSEMSRRSGGRWAGIPVCGDGLSTAQVRMVRKFSLSETAIVLAGGNQYQQKLTTGYLLDLAMHYPHVRAVVLPHRPSVIAASDHGPQFLNDVLTTARPILTYRFGSAAAEGLIRDSEPPDHGPGL